MKTKIMLLMMSIMVILAGCSDPVEEDLLSYINDDMNPLSELEEEIIQDYESVTGANYTNDYELYDKINDVILPKYQDFIAQIEDVKPETTEVSELHELFIDAHTNQYNAMMKILIGIETQDDNVILEANQMLDESRKGLRNFSNKVKALVNEKNLRPAN